MADVPSPDGVDRGDGPLAPAGSARALRGAVESAHARHGDGPAPQFSEDGGGSVFDAHGRCARVQPLGSRTRITLSSDGSTVAEAEVDTDRLVDRLGLVGTAYDALAAALVEENGLGTRPD